AALASADLCLDPRPAKATLFPYTTLFRSPQHRERQIIKNIDLNIRKGEVVGIAGLMGSGRTEFAMSVFGKSYGQKITGEVFLHRSEEHTSELQSRENIVCRLLLEKKNQKH